MSELVATNAPRLLSGAGADPAALLLRSARADAAPVGAKERVRARLGIAESIVESNEAPLSVRPLPERPLPKRSKKAPAIARFIPFQNLVATPKPWGLRKAGAVAVVFVQVAAMLAGLFIRPFPKFETPRETASTHRDEPELVFFAPKKQRTESKYAATTAAESPTLGTSVRGATSLSRPVLVRESTPLKESIVTDEHAGAISEQMGSLAASGALPAEFAAREVPEVSRPMVFQSGMTQPLRISGVDPSYPMRARSRGITGTVIMRCVVTETGLAQNCMILKSPAYLDEAVLTAARSWRFTPVVWQGRAVSVNYVFKIKFQLG